MKLSTTLDGDALLAEIDAYLPRLYPITRSITGDGLRQTLRILSQIAELELVEVPTGTQVLDWTVPQEWNIREAWIKGPGGEKVVEFADHGLHVVNYSEPVHTRLPLSELRERLHTLPDLPDVIPYRTAYYRRTWGFCLPHRQAEALPDGEYEIFIDSSLEDGALTYGQLLLPGETDDEVLISTHTCHPWLANDNLSGALVTALLARHLSQQPRRHTFRFVFVPGTIGSITWLSQHEDEAERVRHGLVAAGLGDPAGRLNYKRTRRGNTVTDRAALRVLEDAGEPFDVQDFVPFGYDERQYNSPGFNLAVGSLTGRPYATYPEYHTSADDLGFVDSRRMLVALRRYLEIIEVFERNAAFVNTSPKGEPQLGRRGLYRSMGGGSEGRERELALLWVLNLSDGDHSLLDIAERADVAFSTIADAADALRDTGLLTAADPLD